MSEHDDNIMLFMFGLKISCVSAYCHHPVLIWLGVE